MVKIGGKKLQKFEEGKTKHHGSLNSSYKVSNALIINDQKEHWYDIEVEVPRSETASEDDSTLFHSLGQEAEELLLQDTTLYNEKQSKQRRSDYQWMQTVMSKGTSGDKLAAFTVQVQDSPVHSLNILKNLVGMVRVGKKKECSLAMAALQELWLKDLLLPDEKLRTFETRPLSVLSSLTPASRNKCLVLWWFESKIKEIYRSYALALEALAKEAVDSGREKAIIFMCQLLSENPEQEQLLLSQVVNKLGDPQQKVASKAIHCLRQVLKRHPNMQPVVLEEVEKLLFRSNIAPKAQYYAICFLTQFTLHEDHKGLAVSLIKVYFCFFKACIKKGNLDSRMLGILLTGVNRAFPYGKDALGRELTEHMDTMHRLVHVSTFNIALQTLCLLYQVAETSSAVGDRFYSALYKKLLDPSVLTSSHQATLLNLVFKAISSDNQAVRIQAFLKRLLQLTCSASPPMACGLLYLVSQVLTRKPELRAMLLSPGASSLKQESQFLDDDDEERYADVKLEDEIDTVAKSSESNEATKPEINITPSWVHRTNSTQKNGTKEPHRKEGYDPLHRNPLFSYANSTAYCELSVLSRHNHPTVSLFANNLLEGVPIVYTGDPLQDFTMARFLERFVFKNPKKIAASNKDAGASFSRHKGYRPSGMKSLAVTSNSYLNEDESKIPCEELYLYRFLQKQNKPWLKSKDKEDESDADSVASDEFERFLQGEGGVDAQPDFADDVGGDFDSGSDLDSIADNDNEEEATEKSTKGKKKGGKLLQKKKKGQKRQFDGDDDDDDMGDLPDVFASAEEFADMLQDTGASSLDVAGSLGVDTRDNAAVKQLQWEDARDRWIRGGPGHKGGHSKNKTRKQNGGGAFKKRKF